MMSQKNYFSRLANELIIKIIKYLDYEDLNSLSFTCRSFLFFVKKHTFGYVTPIWENVEIINLNILNISSCYRNGVIIDNILYIPILSIQSPCCLSINFNKSPLILLQNSIKIECNLNDYEPCKFIATAAIDNCIYIFGGQNIISNNFTNAFYKLNIKNFFLNKIVNKNSQIVPKARIRHSLNSIDNNQLILFGGRCFNGELIHIQ